MQYGKSENERACGQLTIVSGIYDENLREGRAALFSFRQSTAKAIGSSLLGGRLPPPVHSPTKTRADSDGPQSLSSQSSCRDYGANVRLRILTCLSHQVCDPRATQCSRSKVFVGSSTT